MHYKGRVDFLTVNCDVTCMEIFLLQEFQESEERGARQGERG